VSHIADLVSATPTSQCSKRTGDCKPVLVIFQRINKCSPKYAVPYVLAVVADNLQSFEDFRTIFGDDPKFQFLMAELKKLKELLEKD